MCLYRFVCFILFVLYLFYDCFIIVFMFYAQTLILVNLIVVKIIGCLGHNSESSGAFLTKIGGNYSYRPPGPF